MPVYYKKDQAINYSTLSLAFFILKLFSNYFGNNNELHNHSKEIVSILPTLHLGLPYGNPP